MLIVRYTMLDGWYDAALGHLGEENLVEVLGREPDRDGVLSVLELGGLELACEDRAKLGKPEARVAFEYRDERGEPFYTVEARASTC